VQLNWDEYKAVTVNVDKLGEALDSKHFSLKLLEEDVKISITQSNKEGIFYRGYANEVAANEAEFSFGGNAFSCYIDLGTRSYQLSPTGKIVDNETIYVLYMTDYEKRKHRYEEYPIDPLTFEISNEDTLEHNISIEIFDPSNVAIFNENYTISPGEEIVSPDISEVLGKHRYVVILDGNYTFEESATVARKAELVSSEKLYFNFINNSEYPMEVGIEVA
jgi:hypothetical protein